MFKPYEIVALSVCVLLMVVAVWALRTESNLATLFAGADGQSAASGLVVVGEDGAEQTLQRVVADSVDTSGRVTNLIVDNVEDGTGDPVVVGDTVTVHYIGTLPNGQEFDNSRNRGESFTFTVGQGEVIEGWEEGIVGMREGGTRILVIPPDKAYGRAGQGTIPGNATLVFSIELLSID